MNVKTITAKSIITPSKLPGADYVVNPYSGCTFGCVYCYADFMRKFTGHLDDNWGEYVDVKINAPELFKKEFQKIVDKSVEKTRFKKGNTIEILFGSVTDPYQGIESKFKLTRKCLEVVTKSKNKEKVKISMLTKSPLVTRDIDLFKQIPDIEVGMTITSTDDQVSKLFENNAPPVSLRFKALDKLNKENINTYAFVGPLMPHFASQKSKLKDVFYRIKKSGTDRVWVEHINLSGPKMNRLMKLVGDELSKEEKELFIKSQTRNYKEMLNKILMKIIRNMDLCLISGKIIDHNN
jgi:DNA repair photolyase